MGQILNIVEIELKYVAYLTIKYIKYLMLPFLCAYVDILCFI